MRQHRIAAISLPWTASPGAGGASSLGSNVAGGTCGHSEGVQAMTRYIPNILEKTPSGHTAPRHHPADSGTLPSW